VGDVVLEQAARELVILGDGHVRVAREIVVAEAAEPGAQRAFLGVVGDGAFELVVPTVVGPRFVPGAPTGASGTGWSPDTTRVPDASRITPPVAPKGTRAASVRETDSTRLPRSYLASATTPAPSRRARC